MKKKIRINSLTYFFCFSACITGMFKEFLILFSIIILHELGHVIAIKYFNYKIDYIEILPVGGITKINKDINSSINHEIIISLAGITMQLALFILVSFFYQRNFLSMDFYFLFNKYNFSIMLFNLIPIIPLDGSIFFKSLLEKVFSFRLANFISIIFSIINLGFFVYFNYILELNNYVICLFLLYKVINYLKDFKYIYNRFLLERYLKDYNFSKIKVIDKVKRMSKEKKHYILKDNRIVKEHEFLRKYFNK